MKIKFEWKMLKLKLPTSNVFPWSETKSLLITNINICRFCQNMYVKIHYLWENPGYSKSCRFCKNGKYFRLTQNLLKFTAANSRMSAMGLEKFFVKSGDLFFYNMYILLFTFTRGNKTSLFVILLVTKLIHLVTFTTGSFN